MGAYEASLSAGESPTTAPIFLRWGYYESGRPGSPCQRAPGIMGRGDPRGRPGSWSPRRKAILLQNPYAFIRPAARA